jgi:hypothetical protein
VALLREGERNCGRGIRELVSASALTAPML